jgi:hypothetical protein
LEKKEENMLLKQLKHLLKKVIIILFRGWHILYL